jgi:cytochrome c oxidase subunit 2
MSPSFGEFQTVVALVFAGIAFCLALFFALAARQAGRDIPFERVRDAAYRARPAWFAFLALLLSAVVCASLFFLPYSHSRADEAGASATVNVIGGQFYWSMTPETVPAGTEVVFSVTSADVNHGFGVYDPDGELLGNVQAMPGYTNELRLSLDKPGSYLVSCLEFCGSKHHEMAREFEVTEP